MSGHKAHAVLDGVEGANGGDVGAHDIADGRLLGLLAFEDDFAGVVSFGEQSDEVVFFHYLNTAPMFCSAISAIASYTVTSGVTLQIAVPFWARTAPTVSRTSTEGRTLQAIPVRVN